MNSERNGSRTRLSRRCGLCGRLFSFPQLAQTPRECEDCWSARLGRSAPRFSLRRLRLLGE